MNALICVRNANTQKTMFRYLSPVIPRIGESVVINRDVHAHMEVVDVCHVPYPEKTEGIKGYTVDGITYECGAIVLIAVDAPEGEI